MSGGECRGARRKTKEVKKCRAGNQLYTFWTVVKVIDSSSYFGSENGKMRHHWDWTANVADGGKKKFVFLPWKETDILSSKDAPTCISTENINLFGKFVSAPNHRPPFRIPVLKMFGLVCWWKRPVNCGSSEQKLPFLLCQDTSEGTSFGTERNEVRLGIMVECLFQYLFSLCHLVSHNCWCNAVPRLKLKCQKTVHFTLTWRDWQKGVSLPQSLALALHVLPANVAANQPVLKCPAAVW